MFSLFYLNLQVAKLCSKYFRSTFSDMSNILYKSEKIYPYLKQGITVYNVFIFYIKPNR